MSNRLAREASPYLRQHADNPVDWYPWGEEALDKARREDKPIFLSVGYSACHWCHVMAHESFEDDQVAETLNKHFVSIKVDREERPDLDQIYMRAVHTLTGSGGWPMSVFLTPEGEPFFGGTYFPPEPRHGLPGFRALLLRIAELWAERRQDLERAGQQIVESIARPSAETYTDGLTIATVRASVQKLEADHDDRWGGWGPGPKFPQPMALELLLRRNHAEGDSDALATAEIALEAMARGGIYDQLGGGFHRYAVDGRWLVPHFEKMLYDNAQLARVYLHAWQITGKPLYRAIAQETLDYMTRDMRHPAGGFYSAQDADTEGQEGLYYVWTPDEVHDVLGDQAEAFMQAYPITQEGNFEGRNILTLSGSPEERETLAPQRARLHEARQQRVAPGLDDKVLAAWNGLALATFAEAAVALQEPTYLEIARANAMFILDEMRAEDGRLLRVWKDGEVRLQGYLDDHAHVIDGLIALYQATFEPRWIQAAQELMDLVLAHFYDQTFYDTADDHEALIVRPQEIQDNAVPSGASMAALNLLRLARLFADEDYARYAESELRETQGLAARYPTSFGQWLVALDEALRDAMDLAITGDVNSPDTQALVAAARGYHPGRLIAVGPEGSLPILAERPMLDGQATAYVCRGHQCLPPVTDPRELLEQL